MTENLQLYLYPILRVENMTRRKNLDVKNMRKHTEVSENIHQYLKLVNKT